MPDRDVLGTDARSVLELWVKRKTGMRLL